MNIRCPHCRTVFRVDPARVPDGGVRARCSRCGDSFSVSATPEAGAANGTHRQGGEPGVGAYAPSFTPNPPAHTAPAQAEPAPEPGRTAAGAPAFGASDPDARAQRMARALVSDIVAYHGPRRDESLRAGTLRADFRDEILKSWEEYSQQVGQELAQATPYFRNALNEILARGEDVF